MLFCIVVSLYHLVRIIRLGNAKDYSKPAGDVKAAVKYSMTVAMSPTKKESAYLHLPTYAAGILYHIGTFVSFLLLVLFILEIEFPNILNILLSVFLSITTICGVSILIKRMFSKDLKLISNPDDYISNILVTAFQLVTVLHLINSGYILFIFASVLFLYIPFGKLKHFIYFFAARYQLGLFFGHRGTWPVKNK